MLFANWHPLAVLFTTAYIGTWAHEGAHYLAGIPWTRQHEMKFWIKIPPIPHHVDWSNTDICLYVYKFSGAAPLVLLVPGVFIIRYEIYPLMLAGQFFDALFRLPLVAAGCLSKSDIHSIIQTDDWMNSSD